MRKHILMLVSVILCGASASAQELDTARIKKDWPQIVNYVAVRYSQAWIESQQNTNDYQAYKRNVAPNFSNVDLNVDAKCFSNALSSNSWASTNNHITKKILEHKEKPETNFDGLLDLNYGEKINKELNPTKDAVRKFLENEYQVRSNALAKPVADNHKQPTPTTPQAQSWRPNNIMELGLTALISFLASIATMFVLLRKKCDTYEERIKRLEEKLESLKASTESQPQTTPSHESRDNHRKDPKTAPNRLHGEKKSHGREERNNEKEQEHYVPEPEPRITAQSETASEMQSNELQTITALVKGSGILEENDSKKAVYTIHVQKGTEGTFEFSGDASMAFNNIDAVFEGVCEVNGQGRNHIITKQQGKCVLEGGLWRVTQKAKVSFE